MRSILPPRATPYVQRMRRGLHELRRLAGRHGIAVSWLVWALAMAVCVVWVQLYYQAPDGPVWFGKTLRATTCALVLLVIREWCAIRWRAAQKGSFERRDQWEDQDTHD